MINKTVDSSELKGKKYGESKKTNNSVVLKQMDKDLDMFNDNDARIKKISASKEGKCFDCMVY